MDAFPNHTSVNLTIDPFHVGEYDIPILILLNILLIFGIVGNLHVFFIYLFRFKPSVHRMFILILACVDFWACVFEMSYYTMYYRNAFISTSSCQVFNFACSTLKFVSGAILCFIAIDRFRNVCKPFKTQWTIKHVGIGCVIISTVAIIIFGLATTSHGLVPVLDESNRFLGNRCGYENIQSLTSRVIPIILAFITISLMGTSGIFYGVTTKSLLQRKRLFMSAKQEKGNVGINASASKLDTKQRQDKEEVSVDKWTRTENGTSDTCEEEEVEGSSWTDDNNASQKNKSVVHSKKQRRLFRKSMNLTIMFGVSTLVSYLGILIYIIYQRVLLRYVIESKDSFWIFEALSRICLMLNNVINPYVYYIVNSKVRRECKYMYHQLCCRKQSMCVR